MTGVGICFTASCCAGPRLRLHEHIERFGVEVVVGHCRCVLMGLRRSGCSPNRTSAERTLAADVQVLLKGCSRVVLASLFRCQYSGPGTEFRQVHGGVEVWQR